MDEIKEIKATDFFMKCWKDLGMKERQFNDLKDYLLENKNYLLGDVIQGLGARKMRWKLNNNKGKSHGQRIIYIVYESHGVLYLLFSYAKSNQENLTEDQKRAFKKLIDAIDETLKKGNK